MIPKLDAFDQRFSALCELHGKEPSPFFCDMYRKSLVVKLGMEDACKAIEMAFESKTYGFPKPADLIEMIAGNGDAEALHAWELLQYAIRRAGPYKSVHFLDARIARVVQIMGGWIGVNDWLEKDMGFRRQEFIKAYKALPSGGESVVLIGITERDNAARGFLRNIPPPVVIGNDKPKREMLEAPHDAG